MRIAIDIRSLQEGRRTGVEEYTINLLSRLLPDTRINVDDNMDKRGWFNDYVLFSSGKNFNLEFAATARKHFGFSNRLLNIFLRNLQRPFLDKIVGGCDIFWLPNINLAPTSKICRKIITFHDLSFERHPQFFSVKRRLWHKFINPRGQAREAKEIIAVSESTKQDLVDIYGIEPEKIKVIYSGVGEQYKKLDIKSDKLKVISDRYGLPKRFILYLGTIEPRKNIIGIIKAFESLKRNYSSLKLVIAGAPGWLYQNIYRAAVESKFTKDIIFTGFVEDEDKPCLYNLADIFVYPSLFEGFGFPPLEAMACGTPTIVSNNSSLPEVVGDAALMVDPYNIDEIATAIEMILSGEKLCDELRLRGAERAKMFSWERCAEETMRALL